MAVHRLNHAVFFVGDVARSVAFYRDVLGFHVVHSMGSSAAFLRADASPNDHDLGVFQGVPGTPRRQGVVGLYHLAWQVDTIDELVELRARLLEVGALVGESDHGVSKSLYAVDPDGNEFEVMWAVPRDDWPTNVGTLPLDLAAEQRRWTGVATMAQANL